MVRKAILLLLLSATLIPASAAFAVDTPDAKSKCVSIVKGYLKTALTKKLTDDLAKQGMLSPKVRVTIGDLAPATPYPDSLFLKDVLANTGLVVTPVLCPSEPCITPPTITITPPGSAVLAACTADYSIDVKYSFIIQTHEQVDGATKVKKVKIEGSLKSQVSVPGLLAPFSKKPQPK